MQFPKLPRSAIIAHRGASAYAPENTLAAFELAVEQSADAIELDAKLTSDGQVIVIHDQNVDRTTNRKGKVNQHSLADYRKMDAGSYFDPKFHGESVPSLEDVFKTVGQRIYINVELTNYASPLDDLPAKVAELVNQYHLTHSVFFSSFHPLTLLRIKHILPEIPIGLLTLSGTAGRLARGSAGRLLGYQSLNPEHQDVTQELVDVTHKRGCKLFTYTVNEAEEMKRLFKLGVDGIFTNDPLLARQVIESCL